MRAAQMKERPDFPLMRQTDVQQIYHMQMPRWLFSDRRYSDMSLEAKVAYTFLLNRFQLSRRNGWVNEWGEVFVIFPRKELAAELRVCEQRVTAAFRTLVERKLIWEKRCGRGDANQIYLASVSPVDDPDYASAPFLPEDNSRSSRTAGSEVLAPLPPTGPPQEPRLPRPQNHGSSGFRTAESEVPEPQDSGPSYTDLRESDWSHMEVSPPFPRACAVRLADEEAELTGILEACELECFEPEVARVFENAIERLFYSESFRIGKTVLHAALSHPEISFRYRKGRAAPAARPLPAPPAGRHDPAYRGREAARQPGARCEKLHSLHHGRPVQLHRGERERPAR